jgi:TolA-binding protein
MLAGASKKDSIYLALSVFVIVGLWPATTAAVTAGPGDSTAALERTYKSIVADFNRRERVDAIPATGQIGESTDVALTENLKQRITTHLSALDAAIAAGNPPSTASLRRQRAHCRYMLATACHEANNFRDAATWYAATTNESVENDFADDAAYMLGYERHLRAELADAIREFRAVERFGVRETALAKDRIPFALYMIGKCQLAGGETEAARATFEQVCSRFPAHAKAREARRLLERM